MKFVNYYEVLEVSPAAGLETIGRVYRHLAQRHHPDNAETGDRHRFDMLVEAYNVLKHPQRRSEYDAEFHEHFGTDGSEKTASSGDAIVGHDVEIQSRLLSLFYLKRRQSIRDPGIPEYELERTFDRPIEELEFHLWYLKEKRWVTKLENGMFAITVEGIDHLNAEHHRKVAARLLTDQSGSSS